MQKGKMLSMILVAFLMAIIASWVANKMMIKATSKVSESSPSKTVVVAAIDISYGQTLSQEVLALKKLPVNMVQENMFGSIEELEGKVSKDDIFTGDIIVKQRLADKSEGAILASLIGTNMRAVSVRVNDVIGVAGFLLPGNRVDVLASRMDNNRSAIRTLLKNIKVLAVDQTVSPDKEKPVVVRAVTLEVSPGDSEQLFQAIQEGSIHLTLRNPMDVMTSQPEIVENDPVPVQKEPMKRIIKKVTHRKKSIKKRIISKKASTREQNLTQDILMEQPAFKAVTVIRGTSMSNERFN